MMMTLLSTLVSATDINPPEVDPAAVTAAATPGVIEPGILNPYMLLYVQNHKMTVLIPFIIFCFVTACFCLVPISKLRKFQTGLLLGFNVYCFTFENIIYAFDQTASPMNPLLLFGSLITGVVLFLMPTTRMMAMAIFNAYIIAIFISCFSGLQSKFVFFLLEVITAACLYFVVSSIESVIEQVIWTTTLAYIGCLIFSCGIINVFVNTLSSPIYTGTFASGAARLFIVAAILISFFLPTLLLVFKTALFGFKPDEPEKITIEHETIEAEQV